MWPLIENVDTLTLDSLFWCRDLLVVTQQTYLFCTAIIKETTVRAFFPVHFHSCMWAAKITCTCSTTMKHWTIFLNVCGKFIFSFWHKKNDIQISGWYTGCWREWHSPAPAILWEKKSRRREMGFRVGLRGRCSDASGERQERQTPRRTAAWLLFTELDSSGRLFIYIACVRYNNKAGACRNLEINTHKGEKQPLHEC